MKTLSAAALARVFDPRVWDVAAAVSLRAFAKQAWAYINPGAPLQWSWHHDAMCEHLEAVTRGEIQDLLITVPPRHTKSTIVSICWPAWEWGPKQLPTSRWLTLSYAEGLASTMAVYTRHLIRSTWYQEAWGGVFHLVGDQNVKTYYQNNRGGYRMAFGAGGSISGQGGDRIVCDDPHKLQEAGDRKSVDPRENFEQVAWWWDVVVSSRRNDPRRSARVVIMQRLHERDLAAHVIEQGTYVHLNLPQEYEPERACRTSVVMPMAPWNGQTFQDPRTEPNELLWPDRFTRQFADTERARGVAYFALYQQRPVAAGGTVFKRRWWRYWVPPGHERRPVMVPTEEGFLAVEPRELPTREVTEGQEDPLTGQRVRVPKANGGGEVERELAFDQQIQSWDCAFKDTSSSDFVAGHIWATAGPDFFLLDRVHRRMTFTETLGAVRALSKAWPQALLKLVEDKANGTAVLDVLKKELPGLVGVDPKGGKRARAHAVTPAIEAGNVYVPAPYLAPWVEPMLAEFDAFDRGVHDDDVDACLPSDAPLLTIQNGLLRLIRMDQAREGMPVLTHRGRWRAIRAVTIRPFRGHLIALRSRGSYAPLRLTPNHPVLCVKNLTRWRTQLYKADGEPQWVPASDVLPGDGLYEAIDRTARGPVGGALGFSFAGAATPIPPAARWDLAEFAVRRVRRLGRVNVAGLDCSRLIVTDSSVRFENPRSRTLPRFVDYGPGLARLVGYYLAEGSVGAHSVGWTFGPREDAWAEDVRSLLKECFMASASIVKRRDALHVTVSSRLLREWFGKLGHPATEKAIPIWAMQARPHESRELVRGLWRGDGCETGGGFVYATASYSLAVGVRSLLSREGIISTVSATRPGGTSGGRIGAKVVFHSGPLYLVRVYGRSSVTLLAAMLGVEPPSSRRGQEHTLDELRDGWVQRRVASVELEGYDGPVYNLAVEEDESYQPDAFVVHNCTQALLRLLNSSALPLAIW